LPEARSFRAVPKYSWPLLPASGKSLCHLCKLGGLSTAGLSARKTVVKAKSLPPNQAIEH
jgi:hypothetical protein